jgi:general secretion pathway protein G
MNWRQMKFRALGGQARGGFTLIELLLVLVILATLAALVGPRFATRSEQAKTTAAATDIASIGLALDAFEVDCTRLPTTQEGLAALLTKPTSVDGWQGGPYLKKGMPKDPWGHQYNYRCPGQHQGDYDLYSAGPDGQDGTEDDIVNWAKE